MPWDFLLMIFSWTSFPQAPESTIKAVLNFFENSWRYYQLKVHHRCRWHLWHMEKIFNQKSFNYFFCTPLGSRVNKEIRFFLQVHFQVLAVWYCSHYLPPVSLTPVANYRWCHWYRWQFATSVVDTGDKFATGIKNTCSTGVKICRRCRWYQWYTLTCEYLSEFSKKLWNDPNVIFRGLGKMMRERNLKQNILWHCPFKSRAVRTSAKSCLYIRPCIFPLMGHIRKINVTVPNRPVCTYMSSAELQYLSYPTNEAVCPWNFNRSVIIVSGCLHHMIFL